MPYLHELTLLLFLAVKIISSIVLRRMKNNFEIFVFKKYQRAVVCSRAGDFSSTFLNTLTTQNIKINYYVYLFIGCDFFYIVWILLLLMEFEIFFSFWKNFPILCVLLISKSIQFRLITSHNTCNSKSYIIVSILSKKCAAEITQFFWILGQTAKMSGRGASILTPRSHFVEFIFYFVALSSSWRSVFRFARLISTINFSTSYPKLGRE